MAYNVVPLSTSTLLSVAEPSGQTCAVAAPLSVITVTNTGNINAAFNISGGDSFQVVSGAITGYSGANGASPTTVTATSLPSGLTAAEFVIITGTSNYDGVHAITSVIGGGTPTGFVIPVAFNNTETSGGTWKHKLDPGSPNSGWDLSNPATEILGATVNKYGHSYTATGGIGSVEFCDFAGTQSTPTSGTAAFADGTVSDGKVLVTSSAPATHGLSSGDLVTLTGSSNYNGNFHITVLTASTFEINTPFVGADSGSWSNDKILTDGTLTSGNSLLASRVVAGSPVKVFLQLSMPMDTTHGTAPQTMPVQIQVTTAGP